MQRLLSEMCFENVCRQNDKTAEQMRNILYQISRDDHSQSDCFVCVILSHGGDGGYVQGVDESKVLLDDLVSYFKGDNCPSLAGKPKLFFIQACRGLKQDRGVTLPDGVDAGDEKVKKHISSQADILLAYSVVPGFKAWRNVNRGSWFIQAVNEVFTSNWTRMDLMSMMTAVNNKVACDFELNDNNIGRNKQMPCITSTLTKHVFFTKK